MNNLKLNWAGVITSVGSTNSPNLVQIGCVMTRYVVVKYNGSVNFFFPFFLFFPFLRSAHWSQFYADVNTCWLERRVPIDIRAISGFGTFILTIWGLPVQTKPPNLDP